MKLLPPTSLLAIAIAALLPAAFAGEDSVSFRADKEVTLQESPPLPYQGGRGLITLEGPSGMFINPTSGTLSKGDYTVQYCLLFPNNDTDVIGHGIFASYGVTDWLEVGIVGNLIDINEPDSIEVAAVGPMIRVRLLRDREWWPELSVGAYAKFGNPIVATGAVFVAASKRVPLMAEGPLRSVAFHAGYRHNWYDGSRGPVGDSPTGYGGLELELPARLYLIGEISTRDNDLFRRTPYAFGVQWRMKGLELTFAGLQNGNSPNIGIWSGLGISFGL